MAADPLKISLNGNDYEYAAAEVVSVDYTSANRDRLYTIQCKLLNTGGSRSQSDLIQARPLHANIKIIPVIGELVFICKAPTPYHSGATYGREYYYTTPISIQSSVHHNGLPGANRILTPGKSTSDKITNSKVGLFSKLSEKNGVPDQIDPGFPERLDVYPIQPYPGDVIIEGRFGGSIRIGSTIDGRRIYPKPPTWGIGTGATGNPIMVLSNGTNPSNKRYNEFHIESPDDDDASIWLTSGQSVRFKPASTYKLSLVDKEVDLFSKNLFAGNQAIIASDRIILNAKKQEFVAFAKEGIGLSTEKALVLNGKRVVEIESERISLGFNATSPVLLGDRLIDLLNNFFNVMIDMNKSILIMTHPTGVGPSGTPINSGDFVSIISDIRSLINELPTTASKFAFVNEFTGGPSDSDKENFKTLKNNKFVIKTNGQSKGDKKNSISF